MKRIAPVLAVGFIVFGIIITAPSASALGLKVQPLLVREQVSKTDVKKGFIDVSNPSGSAVVVKTEVQAFRQTDSKGTLEFYDQPGLAGAIKLDLDEFELGPREAVRMYYLLDARKLPSGATFAAALFRITETTPGSELTNVGRGVRVGTLLALQNGTPTPQKLQLGEPRTGWLQLGDNISGKLAVTNRDKTGVFPKLKARLVPFGASKNIEGPLLFSGITRDVPFELGENTFGIYKLVLSGGGSQTSKVVLVVTGWWKSVVLLAVMLIALASFVLRKVYFKKPKTSLKKH